VDFLGSATKSVDFLLKKVWKLLDLYLRVKI